MKKIILVLLIATISVSALSHSRDIQPSIDFRKKQAVTNSAVYSDLYALKLRIQKLEAIVRGLQKK